MLTYPEALERLLAMATPVTEIRYLPLLAAAGRVLAQSQFSSVAVPPLDNSAMDGYAVRSADIAAPGVCLPVTQRIPAGSVGHALEPGSAARIFTGAPIPPGADAVVMQELCEQRENGVVIRHLPRVGENIRRRGEDMDVGQEILAAGTLLRPQELALAASAGLAELPVLRRLRVAVFSTGDELHEPGQPLPTGGIYNSNQFALISLLETMGCEVRNLGHIPDDRAATQATLRQAANENDLVITSGGVSVGDADHVKPAVEAEGSLEWWQVAIKPGKPLALGRLRRSGGRQGETAWFVGLPGNPVSAFVTFLVLVRPFLQRLQGRAVGLPQPYRLPAGFAWQRDTPLYEFLRVRRDAAGQLVLFPNQSSAVVTSLVWSEGLAIKPPHARIGPGELVDFLPFAELLA